VVRTFWKRISSWCRTVCSVVTVRQTQNRSNSVLNVIWPAFVDGRCSGRWSSNHYCSVCTSDDFITVRSWGAGEGCWFKQLQEGNTSFRANGIAFGKDLLRYVHTNFSRLCLFQSVNALFHKGLRTKILWVYLISSLRTIYITRSPGKNYLPTFLDTTRATLKTTRPTILLLLCVYSLPR
jgi:hypothetical protein